jgi:hypothetical protein
MNADLALPPIVARRARVVEALAALNASDARGMQRISEIGGLDLFERARLGRGLLRAP